MKDCQEKKHGQGRVICEVSPSKRHHQKVSPWMRLAYLEGPGSTETPPNIHLTRKHDLENIHFVTLELQTLVVCACNAQQCVLIIFILNMFFSCATRQMLTGGVLFLCEQQVCHVSGQELQPPGKFSLSTCLSCHDEVEDHL